MNVYIVTLVSGVICWMIGLFIGCKFNNDNIDDIILENYDLQKENEWLRNEISKIESNNIKYVK